MNPPRSLQKQAGVVIVLALFMVALMATMAYVMLERLMRDTHRTELILNDAQANLLIQGSVSWAKDQLVANWLHQKPNERIDVIPITFPKEQVGAFTIRAVLDDAQSKYNVNNLANGESSADFLRLLKVVAPSADESQLQALIKALMEDEREGSGQSALDRYYAEQPVPYRAAHRLLFHVSELRLVKGMTPTLYEALMPYVIALPQATTINPQTASAPVLMTLDASVTLETANALIQVRGSTPIVSNAGFKAMPLMVNHTVDEKKVNPVSAYFILTSTVNHGGQTWVVSTLLERMIINGRATVRVVWQNMGAS